MHSLRILPLMCAAAFVAACATSGQTRDIRLFAERPPRSPDCEFEVYEQREPPHEYEVIGMLNLTGNQWLGAKGRKNLLRETVCQAGADAVILMQPVERRSAAGGTVRDYEARFISFAPGALEPAALPDLPPAEPGAIVAPRGMEWPEETLGQSTRKWEPKKAQQPTK